jgi:hypothetical protein
MTLARHIPLMSGGEAQGAAIVAHQSRCAFILFLGILELLWVEFPLVALFLTMVGAIDGALVLWSLPACLAYQ